MTEEDIVAITKAQLRKLVEAAMTTDSTYGPVCHVCGAILVNTNGSHTPDCELPALVEMCND